jgi:preprotein translocase subunit SecB
MTKNYEIVFSYIKDLSVEIPDAEAFLFSRENITKYTLGLNISTNPIKDQTIEVITNLNYKDKSENKKKSYFEISYATVIKLKNKEMKKDELERLILCDLQNEIYPDLERIFLKSIKDAGFPDMKLDKKIDFEKLYQQKLN